MEKIIMENILVIGGAGYISSRADVWQQEDIL